MKEGGLNGEAILFFPLESSDLCVAASGRSGVPDSVVDGSSEDILGGSDCREGVDIAGEGRDTG